MNRVRNTIYFDSDDEFMDFAVDQHPVIRQGKRCKYTDFNFTTMYQKEVDNGTRFCIKDDNSQIEKHQAVSFMSNTKEVENLDPWFGIEF